MSEKLYYAQTPYNIILRVSSLKYTFSRTTQSQSKTQESRLFTVMS